MVTGLRKKLKAYFVKGATPTEQQFAELIDRCLIQGDDGIQISSQGDVDITPSVKIKGDLVVDGTFWLAQTSTQRGSPLGQPFNNPVDGVQNDTRSALPTGAILLWYGSDLPSGFQWCDGKHSRPELIAPKIASPALTNQAQYSIRYIIKWSEEQNT